ncbi:dihydrolipoyl dehydrogenase [Bacillaceae bacterium SIJ1]|uniref:dihydrolipoyl dehydrogenase n=1 Tax=Litoribacterium kuwaitense TaxID=1398745 RepID=UPI0013EAC856|nr:dihydrolipoyl dehydrogenase [Litoribacterium kuwaitense]NGP43622.1 dihydrolipoyl dehydrogenase [Litoribacterium kuwaitense]
MTKSYDLIILGGGVGGYTAAIRASQLGMKTAIIEKNQVGGTCLHEGCIPTKAFLKSAEVLQQIHRAERFGIENAFASLNFTSVAERKNNIVNALYKGVQQLMKQAKVDIFVGHGKIESAPQQAEDEQFTVSVNEDTVLRGTRILIATGAKSRWISEAPINHDLVLSSADMVKLTQLPESLTIIGGGVIGVEWASMMADFGVRVTLLEVADRLLPNEDRHISEAMQKSLKKKAVNCLTGITDLDITTEDKVTVQCVKEGEPYDVTSDLLLVAVGREALTHDLGLQDVGINTERSAIAVDDYQQTNIQGIYACGDCTEGPQLAHKAAWQGKMAVEHAAGLNVEPMPMHMIPRCVYGAPQAASVGFTEEELQTKNISYQAKTFPFQLNGKALIEDTEGFAKLLYDHASGDVLGIHLFGDHVTEMIAAGTMSLYVNGAVNEVAEMVFPHPTISESLNEAAKMAIGTPVHI